MAETNPSVVLAAIGEHDDAASTVRALLPGIGSAALVAVCVRRDQQLAAFAAGAHDAVCTRRAEEIAMRAMVWLRAAERTAALERENARLRDLAHRDELTDLGNRRSFHGQLEYTLELARRYGGVVTVVLADLDGMKRLNDTHGHPAGDAALRRVADVFRASIRAADWAARLGGDEFAVVMPRATATAAAAVAERIRGRIESLLLPGGYRLSASFGIASLETAPRGVGFAAEELFSRADAALYEAKRAGKNRIVIDGVTAPFRALAG